MSSQQSARKEQVLQNMSANIICYLDEHLCVILKDTCNHKVAFYSSFQRVP